jgi:hypothetical protein
MGDIHQWSASINPALKWLWRHSETTLHLNHCHRCVTQTQWRLYIVHIDKVKKKRVKQFHYRAGQDQRVPEGWGSQISRQSAYERVKVVSPTHRPPLPPRKDSWYSFLSQPQGHSSDGRIMSMKNTNDTNGNRTRDLNQLRHRVAHL